MMDGKMNSRSAIREVHFPIDDPDPFGVISLHLILLRSDPGLRGRDHRRIHRCE